MSTAVWCRSSSLPSHSLFLPNKYRVSLLKRPITRLSLNGTSPRVRFQSRFPINKWRFSCYRHENFSSEDRSTELIEDGFSENLVQRNCDQSKDLNKDWLSSIQKECNYWYETLGGPLDREDHCSGKAYSLGNLHFLDLSFNNLSGQIPQCFQNFTPMAQRSSSEFSDVEQYWYGISSEVGFSYDVSALLMWKGTERIFEHYLRLKGIDLSSNKLTGKIPPELGKLVELTSLNLSRNQLDGEIPSNIGRLTSIDNLDLSRNHLSGAIPSSFARIDRLAVLDLSYNNLSGKIPTSTQLQSFHMSSYEGNLGLCGKPLEISVLKMNNDNLKNQLISKKIMIQFFQAVLNVAKCSRWIRGYLEKLG
ncbi:hypothetical protein K1719_025157 [Acacia pycnantha]|nr:hypothetical protein K1719_025157 [Acacia pycnantha]